MKDEPYPGMGNVSKTEGLYLQKKEEKKNNHVAIFSRRTPFGGGPVEMIRDKSVIVPARFLYVMYDSFADNKLHFTFASQKKIAEAIPRKVEAVSRLTKMLKETGWITVIRRGLGKPNIIILHQFKNEIITEEEQKAYKAEAEKRIRERFRYNY